MIHNGRNGAYARQLARAQAPLAGNQLPAAVYCGAHADGLQKAVLQNAYSQFFNLFFAERLSCLIGGGRNAVHIQQHHTRMFLQFFSHMCSSFFTAPMACWQSKPA